MLAVIFLLFPKSNPEVEHD